MSNINTLLTYGVLSNTAVNNIGDSIIMGDLGVSPGTTVTGFPPGIVNGTIHRNDQSAQFAHNELSKFINDAFSVGASNVLPSDLNNITISPGRYKFSNGFARITGTIVLDAKMNPRSEFVFLVEGPLTTGNDTNVVFINSPLPLCNVFFIVKEATNTGFLGNAILGNGTNDKVNQFTGNILVTESIFVGSDNNISGRLLARDGSVNLNRTRNIISNCADIPTITSITLECRGGGSIDQTYVADIHGGGFTKLLEFTGFPPVIKLQIDTNSGQRQIFDEDCLTVTNNLVVVKCFIFRFRRPSFPLTFTLFSFKGTNVLATNSFVVNNDPCGGGTGGGGGTSIRMLLCDPIGDDCICHKRRTKKCTKCRRTHICKFCGYDPRNKYDGNNDCVNSNVVATVNTNNGTGNCRTCGQR